MTSPSGSRPKGEVKRFDVTLEGLRQLHQRVGEQQLEPDDWPFLGALVVERGVRGTHQIAVWSSSAPVRTAAEIAG